MLMKVRKRSCSLICILNTNPWGCIIVTTAVPYQVKIQWKDFHHPNVLPLLGIVKNFQDGVALVTPWMSNDAVDYYLRRYPRADRVKLVCVNNNLNLS